MQHRLQELGNAGGVRRPPLVYKSSRVLAPHNDVPIVQIEYVSRLLETLSRARIRADFACVTGMANERRASADSRGNTLKLSFHPLKGLVQMVSSPFSSSTATPGDVRYTSTSTVAWHR